MTYVKIPETGITYYKGKMVDRATINRFEKPTIPDKWKRLGIKIQ